MTTPTRHETPDAAVDGALHSIASARWTRDPDWPSLKEKLVNTPPPRFQFARRRPVLVSLVGAATLCTAAAAITVAYNVIPFRGTVVLDNGDRVDVTGEMIENGEQKSMSIEASGDITSAGEGEWVLPDGRRVKVIAAPGSGKTAASPKAPAPK